MKRILFIVVAVACFMSVANAQETNNPKHIFGVRAGVNFPNHSIQICSMIYP